jgi:hypothetical protein
MTEPEADPAALSIQKVHVQIGRIRPISDRYPHGSMPTARHARYRLLFHGSVMSHSRFSFSSFGKVLLQVFGIKRVSFRTYLA